MEELKRDQRGLTPWGKDGENGDEPMKPDPSGSLVMMKAWVLRVFPAPLIRWGLGLVRWGRFLRYGLDCLFHRKHMAVFCPCCNLRFRSFAEAGYRYQPNRFNPLRYAQTRQDVQCPVCRSIPRHRILAMWCEEHLLQLTGKKILYFAPEYCMMLWMKRHGIAVRTADLNNAADLKLDIQDTGLTEGAYDVIICNHVLEHVDDFRKAMTEMHRILTPGGMLLCSFPMDPEIELLEEEEVPLSEEERIRRFGQNDHKRVFGMKADSFLTEAGFDVEVIAGEDYPEDIVPVVGPADYDMNRLFLCKKQ